ncbi:MAG: hypothetical protein U5R49_21980 [Deltaproteobacteria bacterium]|nr:hypothetical protein [Deltaproteobacteria bacterium]
MSNADVNSDGNQTAKDVVANGNGNPSDNDGKNILRTNDSDSIETGNAPEKGGNMIPKTRFDQVLQQKKDALEALENVANSLAEEIPEDMRDIIPELAPQQKIAWIRNATKKGLFDKQVHSGLDSKRPAGKPALDLDKMQPEQLFRAGYK